MNWINSVVRPKIRSILRKKEMPDNLWVKCPETGQMIYYKDLEANQFVVPGSNYHWRMTASSRLKFLFDNAEYETLPLPEVPLDPLKFRDERRYTDRLKDARSKTGLADAVLAGAGSLDGQRIVAAVQDFDFLGGSLGTAAGEAVITAMRTAVKRETPFILFAASGGARMQEGILSLMQMPRTTVAVQELREARLPLPRGADPPHHRRRHRFLRHARRHPHRRARRADRLCRAAGHRADHPRAAAEWLPAR